MKVMIRLPRFIEDVFQIALGLSKFTECNVIATKSSSGHETDCKLMVKAFNILFLQSPLIIRVFQEKNDSYRCRSRLRLSCSSVLYHPPNTHSLRIIYIAVVFSVHTLKPRPFRINRPVVNRRVKELTITTPEKPLRNTHKTLLLRSCVSVLKAFSNEITLHLKLYYFMSLC